MPSHARLGNWLIAGFMRSVYKIRITDLGSFRAVRKDILLSLGMEQMTFGWPVEMLVKAARRNARIVEVPVCYRERIGISTVSWTIKGSLLTAYYMLWIPLCYATPELAKDLVAAGLDEFRASLEFAWPS